MSYPNLRYLDIWKYSWHLTIGGWQDTPQRPSSWVPIPRCVRGETAPRKKNTWIPTVNENGREPFLHRYLPTDSCSPQASQSHLRPVQTMEHIPRHSLTQHPRTWCSLVWTVSKHAVNMLWIGSEAELYCRGTNQKLSVFRTNTKAFLAAECWFGTAAAAVCATNIFSQTLEHQVPGCCGGCAAEHVW